MKYLVTDIVRHGAAIKEFQLRRADGEALQHWDAGAHIVLQFSSADGSAFERHYSLIGQPGQSDAYRIAVQREENGKGGSVYLHEEIAQGSEMEVSGPFNSFPLAASRGRVLLIAGGIGITPMISMAHALSQLGKPFELHYLAKSEERLVLLDELRAIPHATVVPHLSRTSGRLDLAQLIGAYNTGDSFYACGPAALLQGLAEAAERQGWPGDARHFESFGARTQPGDEPLTVELSLSQMTVQVAPGTSILDALIAADVFVSYDCKRGECGNCYAQVLEGQPLHRDVCLSPQMRATGMCTCVSWAQPGRVVLEL